MFARSQYRRRFYVLFSVLLIGGLAAQALADGNYLIVTASDYAGSAPLNQFIAAKTAMGLSVSTYIAAPGTSRETIKGYIQSLSGTPAAPKFLLIVGDTDGSTATANTIPHWTGGGSRHATTDLPYACMGGPSDWYPDMCLGRFSVRNVSQLQAVVNKSLFVETGSYPDPDYVKRAAFLATDDFTAQAPQTHDWVISTYLNPAEFTATRIYASSGGGTADISAAVNAGSLFVVYLGHSGSSGWSSPSFSQSHVNALVNQGLYGLVIGWSCNTAHYSYDECFGETWLRAANKGAAAYLSASDYVWWGSVDAWESSRRMERYFFRAIFEKKIWQVGPAWQAALFAILNDPDFGPSHDHTRNIFEEMVLLGDPALMLPRGNGFRLEVDPPAFDICTPPTTSVQYSINVELMGEFAEAVTLSTTGLPAGVTATFSANGLPPPFDTTLTIDGLTPDMAGTYSAGLTGASQSQQRAVSLGLSIHAGPPAPVTLLEPADDASDVPLKPEFRWEPTADAAEYALQVATDAGFVNLVIDTTLPGARFTPAQPFGTLASYYWRVQATNACGEGEWTPTRRFRTVNMIGPVSYDMPNGQTGSYTYFDDTYDGDGSVTTPLAPLSNGLGDLTDGVIATQHWNQTPVPYVGWNSVDPVITFHFAHPVWITQVVVHVDDSAGGGGVYPPDDITVTFGGETHVYQVTEPPGSDPFAISLPIDLIGDTMVMTIADHSSSSYIMVSEVEFYGNPIPGDANCDGEANVFDIDPFVLALTDPVAYGTAHPICNILTADCNGDGEVNVFDIDPFVLLLTGSER